LKIKNIIYVALCLSFFGLISCGQSQSHRQSQRAQNEANSQSEMTDLAPAEGVFSGSMHMLVSGQNFKVKLTIKRVYENVRPSQPQDITQPINVPKLNGFMKFPVLDNINIADYGSYSEIINPMGGFSTILFDFGDYDPKTNILILPYNVSGYSQGSFGELQGDLHNGVFKGEWYAKPLGVVGKFKFTQAQKSPK
jgi:hypothetical protein